MASETLKALGLYRSCIKSGEAWSSSCDEAFTAATDELSRLHVLPEVERELDDAKESLQRIGHLIGAPTFSDIRGHDRVLAKHLESLCSELARKDAALREIAIAPCLFELLGEGEECEDSCPGCRARAALASPTAEGTT